jgi:drug/metabolite transporter (DMT)-like permease
MPRLTFTPKWRRGRLWFLSAVVIGLLPILWEMMHNADSGTHPEWGTILAGGDTLVLSAALAGGCVYELLIRPIQPDKKDTKDVLIILAVVAAFGAAAWFADMKVDPSKAAHVAIWTVVYLGCTILICLRSLFLTYDSENSLQSSQIVPLPEPIPVPQPKPSQDR